MPHDRQNFWIIIGCRPRTAKPALIGLLARDEAQNEGEAIAMVTEDVGEDFSCWRLAASFFDERESIREQVRCLKIALAQVGVIEELLDATVVALCRQIKVLVENEIERALFLFAAETVQ